MQTARSEIFISDVRPLETIPHEKPASSPFVKPKRHSIAAASLVAPPEIDSRLLKLAGGLALIVGASSSIAWAHAFAAASFVGVAGTSGHLIPDCAVVLLALGKRRAPSRWALVRPTLLAAATGSVVSLLLASRLAVLQLHIAFAIATLLSLLAGRKILDCLSVRFRRHRIVLGPRKAVTHHAVTQGGDADPIVIGPHPAFSVPEILLSRVTDEVLILPGWNDAQEYEDVIRSCEEMGIDMVVEAASAAAADLAEPRVTLSFTPKGTPASLIKRVSEYCLALLFTVLAFPLMAAIALAIKVGSPGPVLFRHERTGLNGRRFTVYKFRTMVDGAHAMQGKLAQKNEMSNTSFLFKIENDPRVTPLGRRLRRMSLDELPQLFNVLRGELGLIGPRVLSVPLEAYSPAHRKRLSVLPGIACAWQAWHRKETNVDSWMTSDVDYVDNWSLKLDLAILLRTIAVVLRQEGAR